MGVTMDYPTITFICRILSVQCTVYNVLCSKQCTVYSVQCNVQYTVQCTVYSVKCATCIFQLHQVTRCTYYTTQ